MGGPDDHDRLANWLAAASPSVVGAGAEPWSDRSMLAEIDGTGRFEVVRLLTPVATAAIARLLQAGDPVGPILANRPRQCFELLCQPGTTDDPALYGAVRSGLILVCPRPGSTARGRYWLSVPQPGLLTRPANLVRALLTDAPVLGGAE
jgi:hypothetical protein